MIKYTRRNIFSKNDFSELFLSVNWNSGKYPDKLYESINNSTYKYFCYDNKKLIGLVVGLSDKNINLFISYLLVHPNYQKQGIGKELLSKICGLKDFNRISLITEDKDEVFYQKCGLTRDGIGMFKIKW